METTAVLDDKGLDELLASRLLSEASFKKLFLEVMSRPPYADFHFRFQVMTDKGESLAELANAEKPADEPLTTTRIDMPAGVHCSCSVWRRSGNRSGDHATLIARLGAIVRQHWSERDVDTLLPNLKFPDVEARFVAAARHAAGSGMAILHSDLDEFKTINSTFTEAVGTQVLVEFGARLRQSFSELGIAVRTGGDEFSAILECSDLAAMLSEVEAFRKRMETEPFLAISRPNTCSIGLQIHAADKADGWNAADTKGVLDGARGAEARAKSEGRNRTCLSAKMEEAADPSPFTRSDLLESALRMRHFRKSDMENPVRTALRQVLIDRLRAISLAEAPARIDEVRRCFGLQVGSFATATDGSSSVQGVFTPLQWAELVGQALLASTYAGAGPLTPYDRLAIEVTDQHALTLALARTGESDHKVSLGQVHPASPVQRVDLGGPDYPDGDAPAGGQVRWSGALSIPGDPLSTVLLLPIGDGAGDIADAFKMLVADVVQIDDRPGKGGGLPDFWQSNLSRVIRSSLANPNINDVLAIGDADAARLTLKRLQDGAPDRLEFQRRLCLPHDWIETYQKRRLNLRTVPADRTAVLEAILAATLEAPPLDFTERQPVDLDSAKRRRRLGPGDADQANRLKMTDGLRTRTLADAYPEAIQLIRDANQEQTHVEQSRRSFRELSGFKLALTQPLQDAVPEYWQEEPELLGNYYRDNFASPEGVFGRRLLGPFGDCNDMGAFAVGAIAQAIIHQQPTRRINLPIVPDSLEQPLGLSSIQIMPRSKDGNWHLDLLWVWRTVDALVGFPFSAYGSIEWSRDFLKKVKERLAVEEESATVSMGELTYIALSFHLYLHEGDQEIARAIVQDASR